MGRHIEISKEQALVNRINAGVGFNLRHKDRRFLVGVKTLFHGLNPSLNYKDIQKDVHQFFRDVEQDDNLSIALVNCMDGFVKVQTGILVEEAVDANCIALYLGEEEYFDAHKCRFVKACMPEN